MGKTPKPLRFLIHPDIADWPEWAELASQGHTIRTDWPDVDIVVGPRAWRLLPTMRTYLGAVVKEMRKVVYP